MRILLILLCVMISSVARATDITPEAIEYYRNFAPPRVIQILQHFSTFEEVEQFARDRREVRSNIEHNWQKDAEMHRLWKLNDLDIYREMLK